MRRPSRKIVLLTIACLLAVGSILFVYKLTSTKEGDVADLKSSSGAESLVSLISASVSDKDSDDDGLKDWEEVLWNLDPSNPYSNSNKNSDGTRITDSDYVKKQLATKPASTNETSTKKSSLTETDKLSQKIFELYIAAKQGGDPLSTSTKELLVQNALNSSVYSAAKVYTMSDINIGGVETLDAIRVYGNAVGQIILNNSPKDNPDQLVIFRGAITTNKPNELAQLDPIIAGYKNIVRDLLKLKVYSVVASKHLALINATSAVAHDLEAMRVFFNDAITGTKGAQSYGQSSFTFYIAFKDLADYFTANNTLFNKGDGGYVFSGSGV